VCGLYLTGALCESWTVFDGGFVQIVEVQTHKHKPFVDDRRQSYEHKPRQ
jgi:hypothetical protein